MESAAGRFYVPHVDAAKPLTAQLEAAVAAAGAQLHFVSAAAAAKDAAAVPALTTPAVVVFTLQGSDSGVLGFFKWEDDGIFWFDASFSDRPRSPSLLTEQVLLDAVANVQASFPTAEVTVALSAQQGAKLSALEQPHLQRRSVASSVKLRKPTPVKGVPGAGTIREDMWNTVVLCPLT